MMIGLLVVLGIVGLVVAVIAVQANADLERSAIRGADEGAQERLEEEYGRLIAGEISMVEYREEILAEQRRNQSDRKDFNLERRSMRKDEAQAEMDRLDQDEEAIRWRLDWVNEKLASGMEVVRQQQGKWARFDYVDSDGSASKRNIANWTDTGRYVIGFDRAAKEERTFRRDRISNWISG